MSQHDRYQTALDKPERRPVLGPAWQPKPKRVQVSMPRAQRPLFVPDSTPFWPEDKAGWALVKFLAALDLSLIAFLAYCIWAR